MAQDMMKRHPLEIATEDEINRLTAKINTTAADDPGLRDRCFDILRHEVAIDDQRFKDEVERRVHEVELKPLERERDEALKQAGATAKECESLRERIRLLEQETQNDERTDDDGQE